jgi:hypothetical protein
LQAAGMAGWKSWHGRMRWDRTALHDVHVKCRCPRLLSIAGSWFYSGWWQKVNVNQTSVFWRMAGMNSL